MATATASVTLVIIPAPGISFTSQCSETASSLFNRKDCGGITLNASTPVAVCLKFHDHENTLGTSHLAQGETMTLTSEDLHGASEVVVVYLGS